MDETNQGTFKTINQLSKEYGLTKNGMSIRVKKMVAEVKRMGLNESDYVTKGKQNTVYIMPLGLEWLAKWNEHNTPMRELMPNPDILESELEQAKQRISDLEGQLIDSKQIIDHLESESRDKTKQVSELVHALKEQTDLIKFKESQILALTEAKAPEPEPETETKKTETEKDKKEDMPQNAQNAPKSAVSLSDEQLTTELSKRSFLRKIGLLFGH